jgi:hypothetical protein
MTTPDTAGAEIGLADTIGILRQPWMRPTRSSAGRGWAGRRRAVNAPTETAISPNCW